MYFILNKKRLLLLLLTSLILLISVTLFVQLVDAASKINDAGNPGALAGGARQTVRTSTGTLYTFLNTSGSCGIWKSSDGTTWTEQDTANNPACGSSNGIGMAIDSNNLIHLAYVNASSAYIANYVTFDTSTDTFGTPETAITRGGSTVNNSAQIAVDSNNKPHIAVVNGNPSGESLFYANKVSGSWTALAINISTGALSLSSYLLLIDKDDKPEIVNIIDDTGGTGVIQAEAWVGNLNNASSFTQKVLDTSINNTSGQRGISAAVDTSGNTWVSYIDSTNNVTLIKHVYGDGWSTWQASTTNSNVGKEPSVSTNNASDVYIIYQNSTDDVAYDLYTGSWAGETVLQTGTYQDVHSKWSYNFNNQGASQIDYIFSDGTDVYWDKIALSSPPTKIAFSNSTRTLTAGACNGAASVFTMELQDNSNVAQNPTQSTVVRVTSNSSDYTIYSDSNCSTSVTNGDFTFSTSESSKNVYIVDNKKSTTTRTLTGARQSGDVLTTGTQDYTVNAGSVSKLLVVLPNQQFTDGTGITGDPLSQTSGGIFSISIYATDSNNNLNTAYTGDKVLVFTGPGVGSSNPTVLDKNSSPVNYNSNTTLNFSSGSVATQTTLYALETVQITVTDSGSYGNASSSITIGGTSSKIRGGTSIRGGATIR